MKINHSIFIQRTTKLQKMVQKFKSAKKKQWKINDSLSFQRSFESAKDGAKIQKCKNNNEKLMIPFCFRGRSKVQKIVQNLKGETRVMITLNSGNSNSLSTHSLCKSNYSCRAPCNIVLSLKLTFLNARMQALSAGKQIFCIQTKHERADRSVFEPLVYGSLKEWGIKNHYICHLYKNWQMTKELNYHESIDFIPLFN